MTIAFPAKPFRPRRYRPGGIANWSGHLPFAHDLVAALAPSLIVELGTHYGESYFGLCQAVEEHGLACLCYAVDTWRGDEHSGSYGEAVFAEVDSYNKLHHKRFSTLLRCTFDEASVQFEEKSIDLLHIDGQHTYESVRNDFDRWLPRIRPGGVMLIHDIAVRHGDFGVWRLWEEVKTRFRSFEFLHSWGLGVIQTDGSSSDSPFLNALFSDSGSDRAFVARYYADLARLLELEDQANSKPVVSGGSFLQVFPSVNGQYTEADSVLSPVVPDEWVHHILELPNGSPTGPIRIDPANFPSVIEIREIVVRQAGNGAVIARMNNSSDQCELQIAGHLRSLVAGDVVVYLSLGDDPQLLLPMVAAIGSQPLLLEIQSRVTRDFAAGLRALDAAHSLNGQSCPMEGRPFLDRSDSDVTRLLANRLRDLQAATAKLNDESVSLAVCRDKLIEQHTTAAGRVIDLQVANDKLLNNLGILKESEREARTAGIFFQERVRDLEEMNRALEVQLDESQSNLRKQADFELLKTRNESLLCENDELAATVTDLRVRLSRAERTLLEATLQLERERRELIGAVESERRGRLELLRSASWRVTAPLRHVRDVINRLL
jgi:predicted O-methyltransferase YrrM